MSDAMVFSRNYTAVFEKPVSGISVEHEMAKLLRDLGSSLRYKGTIIGHIKALTRAGESYIALSMTDPQKYNVRAGPGWYQKEINMLEFYINVIVFGFSKKQVEEVYSRAIERTFLSNDSRHVTDD